ncbi:MAG: hypothetical protein ACXVZI_06175 [Terriglobales bacterium]
MPLNLVFFILVVVLVVGWFAAGTHTNVRRGEDALRWLQVGLPLVGEKTTLRWLGSSVVELKIHQAKAPFREAAVLVVLEPRDVAPLWWIARLRGRRDLFVFRATLNQRPRIELDARDPKAWTLGGPDARSKEWSAQSSPPLTIHSPANFTTAAAVANLASVDGCAPVRLAIYGTEPNLEVQWPLAQIRKHEARQVLETVRELVQRA